jgi:hypothetical protein
MPQEASRQIELPKSRLTDFSIHAVYQYDASGASAIRPGMRYRDCAEGQEQ